MHWFMHAVIAYDANNTLIKNQLKKLNLAN